MNVHVFVDMSLSASIHLYTMPWCEVLGGGCCCGLVLEGDHYLLSLNLHGLKGFYR